MRFDLILLKERRHFNARKWVRNKRGESEKDWSRFIKSRTSERFVIPLTCRSLGFARVLNQPSQGEMGEKEKL